MSPLVQCMPLCWAGAILTSVVRNACRSDTHIVTSLKTERSAPASGRYRKAARRRRSESTLRRFAKIRNALRRRPVSWMQRRQHEIHDYLAGRDHCRPCSIPLHTHRRRAGSRSASDERRSQSSGTTDVWGSKCIKTRDQPPGLRPRGGSLHTCRGAAVEARNAIRGSSELFGETLKTNDFVRNAGFDFLVLRDWRAARFDEKLPGNPRLLFNQQSSRRIHRVRRENP
jgi:hypothetical protein